LRQGSHWSYWLDAAANSQQVAPVIRKTMSELAFGENEAGFWAKYVPQENSAEQIGGEQSD
jgi:hypothetical protein